MSRKPRINQSKFISFDFNSDKNEKINDLESYRKNLIQNFTESRNSNSENSNSEDSEHNNNNNNKNDENDYKVYQSALISNLIYLNKKNKPKEQKPTESRIQLERVREAREWESRGETRLCGHGRSETKKEDGQMGVSSPSRPNKIWKDVECAQKQM